MLFAVIIVRFIFQTFSFSNGLLVGEVVIKIHVYDFKLVIV